MIDLDQLEALARAATPGPWRPWALGKRSVYSEPRCKCGVPQPHVTHAATRADTKFIAAANPETVLELIAEVRRLRADTSTDPGEWCPGGRGT